MAHTAFIDSVKIQKNVIVALFFRELKTRFGRHRLGYVWSVLEPMAHVLVLTAVLGFSAGTRLSGVDFAVFVVSGVVPWLLFSGIVTRSMSVVSANRALFFYRQVKPIDAFISRAILESIIYCVVLLLLLASFHFAGFHVDVNDLLGYMLAILSIISLAVSLGLVFFTLVGMYPETQKFIALMIKPLYFVSGVFFSVSMIPAQFRELLLYNPVLHCIEVSRGFLFSGFKQHPAANLWYVMSIAFVSCFIGLAMYRLNRFNLVSSR